MPIIDANTMIGLWPTKRLEFCSAEGLIKKMDYYSIDQAVVYSSISVKHNPIEGNMELIKQVSNFQNRLIPCWVVLPTWELETGKNLLEELKNNNIKVVRLFPKEHNFLLDEWVCGRLFSDLQAANIPLILDGSDVSPAQIHAICKTYPKLPIILAQSEYFLNRNLYKLFELHQNFYLELSTYFIYYGVEDIVRRFGPSRLLYGSRMPFQEAGAALGMIKIADISIQDKNMILYENLNGLIGGCNL